MKAKVKEICSVSSGVYSQSGQLGNAIYLQANYFDEYGNMEEYIKPNLVLDDKTRKHLLDEGDVLFAAKGMNNFAVSVKNKMGACVASSTFLVLRIKEEFRKLILPEYLVWFLNHPNTQVNLKAKAIGTGLPSISKKALEKIEIEVPSMTTQQNIIIIDELRKREKQLRIKIEGLREKQVQHLLYHLTTGKLRINGK